ncbi:hypothetical protein SLE2022_132340 [Rubroshorea leprosula]
MTRSSVSRALHLASLNRHPSLLLLDLPGISIRSGSLTPRSSSLSSTLSVTPIGSRWHLLYPPQDLESRWPEEKFKNLLQGDDFYRIRLPFNVLSPPGRDYIISSVKVRCLPREGLDEHFVINTEGVNILAVNYGSPGACAYPRQLKLPFKWAFNSHTVLKDGEQAPRTPIFTKEVLGDENGESEVVQPPEMSFWAKYWMYLIPVGLISHECHNPSNEYA